MSAAWFLIGVIAGWASMFAAFVLWVNYDE